MADEFDLNKKPVRATGAIRQALDQALEISDYDEVDVICSLLGVEGTTTGLGIRLLTGMSNETENGWVVLLTFTAANLNGPNTNDVQNASTKLLKYLRWEVTGLGGATAVTFDLSGMLRKRGM